jgi:hypothetical protein
MSTDPKLEFLSAVYQVLQSNPTWARETINTVIDGFLNGSRLRYEQERDKRAAAEIALAFAYDHLKKGISENSRGNIEHVLAHSLMFEGTDLAKELSKKGETYGSETEG